MDTMTVLSREMFDCATRMDSIGEAAKTLLEYRKFRTLADVLRAFSGRPDVNKQLAEGLMAWNPQSKRDSVDRKVRNWLGGKNQSIDKQDAFVLSRALGLSLEQTNEFLKRTSGEGIHWRNPQDIVWCYAITQGLDYDAIHRLLDRAAALGTSPKATAAIAPGSYTAEVYEKLQDVLHGSEEALLVFLEKEWANLGAFHNTAYHLFTQYMLLLEQGFSDEDVENLFQEMTEQEKRKKKQEAADREQTARSEAAAQGRAYPGDAPRSVDDLDGDVELYQPEDLTSREILEVYLYRDLVPANDRGKEKKADAFSAIRRSIRQNWPDEFTLSRMKNRQMDISRKVLILLFLATDGSSSDYAEMDEDEELLTEDDIFLDIYTRMDLMLTSCGFPKLDPRSPFDWMILYCICAGDLWESDRRLQEILAEMFPEEE